MRYYLTGLIIVFILSNLYPQIAVGKWRDHLAYNQAIRVIEVGNRIYCATTTAVFYYDKNDNSINKISKINGLSDVGVSSIAYNENNRVLFISYTNANIDLLDVNDNTVYNISDIKRKQITGNKTINDVMFIDDKAYLSCGFGIVVVDIVKKEIMDTYYIGNFGTYINVHELTYDDQYIYAATEKGIYKGLRSSPYLVNYQYWEKNTDILDVDGDYSSIAFFNGDLYYVQYNKTDNDIVFGYDGTNYFYLDTTTYYGSDIHSLEVSRGELLVSTTYLVATYDSTRARKMLVMNYVDGNSHPEHAIYDYDGDIWVADAKYGLIKFESSTWTYYNFYPNCPVTNDAWNISIENSKVWIASGAIDGSWNNRWNRGEIYSFINETWQNYNEDNNTEISSFTDIINVIIDPANDNRIYLASWGDGIGEFSDNLTVNSFDEANSSLEPTITGGQTVRVYGLDYDSNNNLWITNSMSQSPISVKTPEGNWYGFEYGSFFENNFIGDILATSNNHKWVVLPRGKGLFAFDEKGTYDDISDDDFKAFSVLDENGKVITNDLFCIAEDLDGAIWLGTNKGVLVYYQPENVFTGDNFYAQQIIIEIDGNVQYLLETETVTSIVVDGSNRKWIGTEDGGVFLMSEDGTEQILNFNEENSPLLSNTIKCMEIDHNTGELFIGTDKGIISYRSDATTGSNNFENVYVFPNPVRETYTGLITVKGLVANSNVKFTDISGNVVFETTSEGGSATWDGLDFNGDRVHTGVYLVFCTNEDGTKTHITKLLFIN